MDEADRCDEPPAHPRRAPARAGDARASSARRPGASELDEAFLRLDRGQRRERARHARRDAAACSAQLRRDPRTIALIVVVPCVLEMLLKELFAGRAEVFQHIGAPLLGLFPFVTMFLVTSITMLRERTSGTLERLMTLPLAKLDLLAGYGLAFALVAVVQAAVVSALAFGLLGLDVAGPRGVVVALAVGERGARQRARSLRQRVRADGVPGGAVHAGGRVPADPALRPLRRRAAQMATWLRWLSDALPLTYAYDALAHTAADTFDTRFAVDVAVVCGCIVARARTRRRDAATADRLERS